MPSKNRFNFSITYTNKIQYTYVSNTIENFKKKKELELGKCTYGEALFYLCKELNDTTNTYKIETKYGDQKEKVLPYYYQKDWLDTIDKHYEMLDDNTRGGYIPDTYLREHLSEAYNDMGEGIRFSKEVEDRYEEYEYYIKKLKEEAEKFNGKIKKN